MEMLLVPVVAGCVVWKDDKVLLVQEKQSHVYGLWNLPAGHVDKGETFEAAAIRETEEETGFTVKINAKLPIEHPDINRPVLHAYTATIISGVLRPAKDELLDVQWFTFDEIQKMHQERKLRNDWVNHCIILSRS